LFGSARTNVKSRYQDTIPGALRPEQTRQMYDQAFMLLSGNDLGSMVDLSRISARTLIVNGEADPLIDPYDAVMLARRLRAATIHIEPDALPAFRAASDRRYLRAVPDSGGSTIRRKSRAHPGAGGSTGARFPYRQLTGIPRRPRA
jgi:hypothetical protein